MKNKMKEVFNLYSYLLIEIKSKIIICIYSDSDKRITHLYLNVMKMI